MARFSVSLWIAFFASACSVAGNKAAEAPVAASGAPAGAMPDQAMTAGTEEAMPTVVAQAMPADAAPPAPREAPAPEAPSAPMAVPPAPPSAAQPGTAGGSTPNVAVVAREMLDIQASLQIKVDNLNQSLKAIHELARKHKGTVTEERLQALGGSSNEASLTLRIPSGASDVFFDELRRVGEVLSQQISVRDVGKEFHDAGILLRNLEATMNRYEEILKKANNVQEILHVESELARLRAEIDRVKGNLRWLADRAARATVQITLRTDQPQPQIVAEEPEARFYPGAHATYLGDYQPDETTAGYLGAGVSLRFSRQLSIDLDGLRNIDSDKGGLDVFLATVGSDIYSEFFGDGSRRWLNPYLGIRLGYARILNADQAVAGITLGLEIFKTDVFEIDADVRLLGFFFGKPGAHAAIQPTLGANVAF